MFPLKTVQCVGVYYIFLFVLASQICYSEGYVKINNLLSDGKVETQILHSVDPFALDVSNVWENQVKFITTNDLEETEEGNDDERGFVENWIVKSWNNKRKVRQIDQSSNQKRVPRQSNIGYSPIYPTVPTTASYGNYGLYNFNNVSNANRQWPSTGLNITSPTHFTNYSRPSNSNFTFNGPNPYQYNSQYPTYNGINSSYPHYTNTFKPGTTNGMYQYNSPTPNYNNSRNPYIIQPGSRPVYPGAANNGTNFASHRTTARPYYPGTTNFAPNPNYPQSPYRPFSPATSNNTFPGYPQPNPYNTPAYSTSTSRPFYPGSTNNVTKPYYPQTSNRPFYPGANINGTNPNNPQPPNRPIYPGPANKPMHNSYTSPSPINHHNSVPPFNNGYNNSRLPAYNLPSSSPYNPYNGYPAYNTNGSSQGTVPRSQHPFYNNSGPYNSGVYGTQGQGQHTTNQNSTKSPYNTNWNNSQYRPYNHTNGYKPTPNYQNFGNFPNSPYSGKPNIPPNNAGSEHNNFFYPPPNSGPNYDPRKNPPNQFSLQ